MEIEEYMMIREDWQDSGVVAKRGKKGNETKRKEFDATYFPIFTKRANRK